MNSLVRVYKWGFPVTARFKLSSLFAPIGGVCATGRNFGSRESLVVTHTVNVGAGPTTTAVGYSVSSTTTFPSIRYAGTPVG